MINPFDDGGPAFPHLVAKGKFTDVDPVAGMTLRDYFAGQALVGVLSHPDTSVDPDAPGALVELMRVGPWAFADAMLKAREATT